MDPIDNQLQLQGSPFPNKAWRCTACNALMFNRDAQGYPIHSYPIPHFISLEYPKVCTMCHGMVFHLYGKQYWETAHDEWKAQNALRKRKNDGLSGKTDYFEGR